VSGSAWGISEQDGIDLIAPLIFDFTYQEGPTRYGIGAGHAAGSHVIAQNSGCITVWPSCAKTPPTP